ncbi:hypothetical protein CRE_21836 [Caenorhabditis remanei]|uniref:Uncharacterized protein n=1 Tax=Caenorhabditis remanei TaxID=31234 RepID=E3MER4_CAERE|nr:hypothetical protein CRE_21836 [Caenorhabditis remanei]
MGANQSHNDTDDSESSESSKSSNSYDSADDSYDSDCSTTEEISHLENYPDPLGRFKSIFVIKNISKIIENMDIKPTHHSKWFHKMNVSFSHGISLINPRTTLCFYVACRVKNTVKSFWKVKANVIIKIQSFTMERGTITINCGELCFSLRDSNMLALHGRTNLHLVDLLGEYHTWLNRKKSIKKKDVEDLDIEMMSGEIMKAIVKRVFEVGWKMDEEN